MSPTHLLVAAETTPIAPLQVTVLSPTHLVAAVTPPITMLQAVVSPTHTCCRNHSSLCYKWAPPTFSCCRTPSPNKSWYLSSLVAAETTPITTLQVAYLSPTHLSIIHYYATSSIWAPPTLSCCRNSHHYATSDPHLVAASSIWAPPTLSCCRTPHCYATSEPHPHLHIFNWATSF